MANLFRMQVLDCGGHLVEVELSLRLVQLCLLDDLIKKLTPLGQLQDNEEVVFGVDYIFEIDDVWVGD